MKEITVHGWSLGKKLDPKGRKYESLLNVIYDFITTLCLFSSQLAIDERDKGSSGEG